MTTRRSSKVMAVLYAIFLVTMTISVVLGLVAIWGGSPHMLEKWGQLLATCILIAFASALTLSATRVMSGAPPSEDN